MKIIPYSTQTINSSDIKSVIGVLKSNFLTQGPTVELFEKSLSKKFNSKFSVCVNSATSGLHLVCIALGLKKDDYLWTSPNSFVASSNCGLYCGAKIDFVDIDSDTFNICEKSLKKKLKNTPKSKLPKIVVVVHFAGNPVNLLEIKKLSKKYNFKIIEDASHATGAKYRNTTIGDCSYSDAVVFSFHPVKIITTGEGGAILTKSKKIYEKVKILRNHGIQKNIYSIHKSKDKSWFYQQKDLGFNYRMNDIEAALGLSQIRRITQWVKKRNDIADYYKKRLKNLPIKFQTIEKNNLSTYHLFVVSFNSNLRNKIFRLMRSKGIYVNIHYIPIHIHKFYKKLGFREKDFPKALKYYNSCISLPIFPSLKKKELNFVIDLLAKNLK